MSRKKSSKSRNKKQEKLFVRWFWLVYVPLGLFIASVTLLLADIYPRAVRPVAIGMGLYTLFALRLLMERRRKGLSTPPPRKLMIGIGTVTGLLLIGTVLFVVGMNRLTTNQGLALAAIGGFFMILSVTVPAFKLIDSMIKGAGRVIKSAKKGLGV